MWRSGEMPTMDPASVLFLSAAVVSFGFVDVLPTVLLVIDRMRTFVTVTVGCLTSRSGRADGRGF